MRKFQSRKWASGVIALAIVLAESSFAGCFRDCKSSQNSPVYDNVQQQQGQTNQADNSFNRENSHNVSGTNKNAVMGDMEIKIGHQNLNVGTVGKNSTVNNSISSTIVLGDMNQ